MKTLIVVIAVAVSMCLVAVPHADAARIVVGVGVGPYWGPWGYAPYYYPPAYVYPPVYVPPPYPAPVVAAPQSYIQEPIQQAPTPSYWYYCEGARAYYPYVKECPGGWLTVVPPAAPESQR